MAAALRSEAEAHRLVEENRRLVDYMVNRYLKKYYVGTMERDDLVSWGTIGLLNAAKAWDPKRSAAFSTLACRAIERMIIRGVNREWKPDRENRTYSIDELISADGEGGSRFVDQIRDDQDLEQDVVRADNARQVRAAVARLAKDQRSLIERHYLNGEPVKKIAADLGLTRQGVYSREKMVLKRLRRLLGDEIEPSLAS